MQTYICLKNSPWHLCSVDYKSLCSHQELSPGPKQGYKAHHRKQMGHGQDRYFFSEYTEMVIRRLGKREKGTDSLQN
jgi:hypothetical protein